MAYGVGADVTQLLGRIGDSAVGSGKILTDAEITDLIDSHSDEIDTILLARGVVLPVDTGLTGGSAFAVWLARLVAHGVAAAALRAISPEVRGTGGGTSWGFHETRYRDGKKLLVSGDAIPPALGGGEGDNEPAGYFEDNPDEIPEVGDNFDNIKFSIDREF